MSAAVAERPASDLSRLSPEQREQMLKAATRLLKVKQARDSLVAFAEATMPHPSDPSDPTLTRYDARAFHRAVANAFERVESGEIKRLILEIPPRHGKSLAHDTPVLTPAGWTTHGELKVGDQVYGPDGLPVRVVALSQDVDEVVPVQISNGEVIRCHLNHEWTVYDRSQHKWRTMETRALLAEGLWSGPRGWAHAQGARGSRARFQLPPTSAVEYPAAVQPLHPYVLGAWLGDGSEGSTRIAHAANDQEVPWAIEACGYPISGRYVQAGTGVAYASFSGPRPGVGSEFQRALKTLDVLRGKHIPEGYLRASTEQRLQLLAGLVDTDGSVEPNTGRVRFSTCSPELRDGVFDLAAGLNFRPYVVTVAPATSSSGIVGRKPVYQVCFQPDREIPVRIPRKRVTRFAKQRRLSIAGIGPVERAPARSIQVARDDGLYLAGRRLVPTHNTELLSRRGMAWVAGRNPFNSYIFGTYNQEFADDGGRAVRDIIASPGFSQVFPEVSLKKNSAASDRMQVEVNGTTGGSLFFVGRGGSVTGRGGNGIIIDDPIKNSEEADSANIREQLWTWFQNDILSRLMDDQGWVVVIQTRWHEDDLIGRLTDPKNPNFNEVEAKLWRRITIPALAEQDDVLGRAPGEALWPERFGVDYLESFKRRNPRGFNALYQQRPTPEDGDFIKAEYIREYLPHEVPTKDKLRVYMASDHAVAQKQHNDRTCILVAGVDTNDNIWILDCYWKRATTDTVVEKLIDMVEKWDPLRWWAEDDHITKSIGPFLKKRMRERRVYMPHSKVNAYADKRKKAQAIQGRMSMGMVYFPKQAPWYQDARDEMLKFPFGTFDDFMDALSTLGRGMGVMVGAAKPVETNTGPRVGSFGWLKQAAKQTRDAEKRRINMASY